MTVIQTELEWLVNHPAPDAYASARSAGNRSCGGPKGMWPFRTRSDDVKVAVSPTPSSVPPVAGDQSRHVGNRRKLCWWEPIYDPPLDGVLEPFDWRIDSNSGPSRRYLLGAELNEHVEFGNTYKIEQKTFQECDFQGKFEPGTIILFDQCNFIKCDFAFSQWRDTNFRNCTFQDCSLALSTFERCEFRDCSWQRIGFSGSKTDFIRSFMTNPRTFVRAGYSGCNPKTPTFRHRMNQWYRLQGTKAHVLRSLLLSHETVGDDITFYKTARLHDVYESWSRHSFNIFNLFFREKRARTAAFIALFFNAIEHLLLMTFGSLNGWGASATRPLLAVVTCFLLFGLAYTFLDFGPAISNPWQKSFEITAVAGYTNHKLDNPNPGLNVIQSLHLCIAIVLYSVFFATIVAKLSRVR